MKKNRVKEKICDELEVLDISLEFLIKSQYFFKNDLPLPVSSRKFLKKNFKQKDIVKNRLIINHEDFDDFDIAEEKGTDETSAINRERIIDSDDSDNNLEDESFCYCDYDMCDHDMYNNSENSENSEEENAEDVKGFYYILDGQDAKDFNIALGFEGHDVLASSTKYGLKQILESYFLGKKSRKYKVGILAKVDNVKEKDPFIVCYPKEFTCKKYRFIAVSCDKKLANHIKINFDKEREYEVDVEELRKKFER